MAMTILLWMNVLSLDLILGFTIDVQILGGLTTFRALLAILLLGAALYIFLKTKTDAFSGKPYPDGHISPDVQSRNSGKLALAYISITIATFFSCVYFLVAPKYT